MRGSRVWVWVGTSIALAACGDEDDVIQQEATSVAATGASGPATTSTGAGGAGGAATMDCTTQGETLPPTGAAALLPWLQAGSYKSWPQQSSAHTSSGPHFGLVRVYINPALCESLNAGAAAHPQNAASVKELYGQDPQGAPQGWSVQVKLQADSAGGANWYWFERFNTSQFADGNGVPLCVNCHVAGKDFFRTTPFPLE